MAEYIEREGIKRAVVEAVDAGLAVTSGDLEEIMDDMPAADVAPVRHGRWEYHLMPIACKCSACGYRTSNSALRYNHMNYCPNCGAKMDT